MSVDARSSLVGLCLLALLSAGLSVRAEESAPEVAVVPESPESWVGRSVEDLEAFWGDNERSAAPDSWLGRSVEELTRYWGEPTHIKQVDAGRTLYRFRQEFTELDLVEAPLLRYSDVGVGTDNPDDDPWLESDGLAGFNPQVPGGSDLVGRLIARRKAKFWIGSDGKVVAEEIGNFKWKKGYGPED